MFLFLDTNIIKAASKTYTFEADNTVTIVSNNNIYYTYEKKNGKMRRLKSNRNISKENGEQNYWKANKVEINGKVWWQIADNKYLRPKNISIIDEKTINIYKTKYKNYTPDLPEYDGKSIILIGADPKSDSKTIGLYSKKNDKLIYTGNRVNAVKGRTTQFWKADKVTVNGKTYWQVGKNLYFKPTRIVEVDIELAKKSNEKIQNFGNYPEKKLLTGKEPDTILVNNTKGSSVPLVSLQGNGKKFQLINNRSLANNSTWIVGRIMKINEVTYCQVSTNEWVDVTNYVINPY